MSKLNNIIIYTFLFFSICTSAFAQVNIDSSKLVTNYFYKGLDIKNENKLEAINLFSKCIEIDPNCDAAYYELSNIHSSLSNLKKASIFINKANEINPNNIWYLKQKASIDFKTGDLNSALDSYNKLITKLPNDEDLYISKATILINLKRIDEALALLNETEAQFGISEDLVNERRFIYIKRGEMQNACNDIERLLLQNSNDVRLQMKAADFYAANKMYKEAIEKCNNALFLDPNNVYILFSLSDYYKALHDYDKAFDYLKKGFSSRELNIEIKEKLLYTNFIALNNKEALTMALELSDILIETYPDNITPYQLNADLAIMLNNFDKAYSSLKKVIGKDSTNCTAWSNLLRIDLSRNNLNAAIENSDKALSLCSNEVSVIFWSGIINLQLDKYNKAIELFSEGLELTYAQPGLQSEFHSYLGDTYNRINKYKESDDNYEKSLSLNPDNHLTLNNYAYYLSLRKENLEKAKKMSLKSNELDPNNSSYLDTYAWILFELKDYENAKIYIERSIKSDNNPSATLYEHYGDIMYKLGNKRDAVKAWKKALNLPGEKSKLLQKKVDEQKFFE